MCDDKWDYRDATVVCRQLGYNGRKFKLTDIWLVTSPQVSSLLPASYAFNKHSSNNNSVISMDDVSCYGNETKLSECEHRGIGIHNCIEGTDEAGVLCTSKFYIAYLHIW